MWRELNVRMEHQSKKRLEMFSLATSSGECSSLRYSHGTI